MRWMQFRGRSVAILLACFWGIWAPRLAYCCGDFPAGVASADRVLSFLPSSGAFRDQPRSSAGGATEGMVVYDSEADQLQYCDGTHWHAFGARSTAGESAPAIAAAWGYNGYGQLGSDDLTQKNLYPQRLNAVDFASMEWLAMSTRGHTCGLRLSDGQAFCAGNNNAGQLGIAWPPVSLAYFTSVGSTAWKAIGTGAFFTCAIRSDDRIYCWGDNGVGNLGNGTITDQSAPTALSGMSTTSFKTLSVGSSHTCAIRLSDNLLYCWGTNGNGQLGLCSITPNYATAPTALGTGWNTTAWKDVSSGENHTCAIRLADNQLHCWGLNTNGNLGTGDTTSTYCPNALSATNGWNTTEWKSVSAGLAHTCGIRLSDNRVYCWGKNTSGQLGTGNTTSELLPTALSTTDGWSTTAWKSVSAGNDFTCAIRLSDDQLFCWGWNHVGELGNGDTTNRSLPTPLTSAGGANSTKWKSVSVNYSTVCAIRLVDNRSFCWGYGFNGKLGTGNAVDQSNPTAPASRAAWDNTVWKMIEAGGNHTCGILLSDEKIYCWGDNTDGKAGLSSSAYTRIPQLISSQTGMLWKDLDLGEKHSCGLLADGRMFCWGSNDVGQLGRGNTIDVSYPVALDAAGNWNTTTWSSLSLASSLGGAHTCAIRASDSQLFCWGTNRDGQLGDGNSGNSSLFPIPLTATGGWNTMTWKAVSAGTNHTCAIRSDDRLFCWGMNGSGELGDGSSMGRTVPTALASTGGWNTMSWKAVVAGSSFSCAIRSDDLLFCWGSNTSGRLGTGDAISSDTPRPLASSGGWNTMTWKAVDASYFPCAIRSDDRIFCWGGGYNGQLGNGTTIDSNLPVPLSSRGSWDQTKWKSVSTGGSFVLALEGPPNFANSTLSPAGVGSNDLTIKFPSIGGNQRTTKFSAVGSPADFSRGILTYDSAGQSLLMSNGYRWIKVGANSSGVSCSSYPDGADTRVIEFKADGSNLAYNSSRSRRASPRAGSLIYNPTLRRFQVCDGTNWQNLSREATLVTYSTPGTYSYTVPPDATSIEVESWGAGAGGGTQSAQANGGGGGGYSRKALTVTPNETLTIVVGAGGSTGVNGQDSSVKRGATVLATATGGLTAGGASTTPGAGLYDIWYPGGAGAAAQGGGGSRAGSGGGGGAGSTGAGSGGTAGNASTAGSGGVAGVPDGGTGGNGGAPTLAGVDGTAPGGGGGGSGSGNSTSGTGGNGRIRLVIP